MKTIIQVKLEGADERKQEIMRLCLQQCLSPNDKNLLKIGSYIGYFANNLRSALNYTMNHFFETRMKLALSPCEYKSVRRNKDFPWTDSKTTFDKKELVTLTRNNYRAAYDLLERVQPYHKGNEWLARLMKISN
jgi:hypothetical protein